MYRKKGVGYFLLCLTMSIQDILDPCDKSSPLEPLVFPATIHGIERYGRKAESTAYAGKNIVNTTSCLHCF